MEELAVLYCSATLRIQRVAKHQSLLTYLKRTLATLAVVGNLTSVTTSSLPKSASVAMRASYTLACGSLIYGASKARSEKGR
eukprot:scaffold160753_cov36-Prasinocladus_malaysianus.AAC.1